MMSQMSSSSRLAVVHFSTVTNDSDTARFFRKLPQRPSNALFIPEGRRHNPVHGIYEAQLSRNEAVAIYSGTAAWSPSLPPPGTKPPLYLRPSRPRQIFFLQLSTKIGKNFPTERNFPPNTHTNRQIRKVFRRDTHRFLCEPATD